MVARQAIKADARRRLKSAVVVFLSFILGILLLVNISLLLPARSNSGTDSRYLSEIHRLITENMKEDSVPGAIVGVWIPERGSWVVCEGVSDLRTGRAIQPTDKVRIASVTKTFVVTVLLQLVDQKLVALDDTLDKYVPWLPNGRTITVRQICNHTSGLPNYGDFDEFEKATAADPLRKWTPDELVRIATSHPPEFPPGQAYHYSNTNTVLVGMIIEKITGVPVAETVRRRIIGPLRLIGTVYPEGPETPAGLIDGYVRDGATGTLKKLGPLDPSMGGASLPMISCLSDLKVWAKALVTGRLLTPETQTERLEFIDTRPGDSLVGQGLGVFRKGDFIGHEGIALGFQTAMYYLPSTDAVIIIILNRSPSGRFTADEMLKGIINIFYPGSATW